MGMPVALVTLGNICDCGISMQDPKTPMILGGVGKSCTVESAFSSPIGASERK